ncbi:hypothetical protein [Clostridium tagluense]|uniref:hypothetical protein n=1 Tax=Clostridium tagluense TaxID=360422 RepID=UPI001CF299B7|nr:hypothetical protein [Clostridium tagluense]MCB2297937.1 hypothetical protein [Clostridium tagluense]
MYKLRSKPHVVILGAGASIAAIPNGDKNGNKTSVMKGFIKELGMEEVIKGLDLDTTSDNLEDIYSELVMKNKYRDITEELENRINDYFLSLAIPDEPTVYDFLLLSLTDKDLIATFNWDPLLLQAYQRVNKITTNLPNMTFLHGNVAYGSCKNKHKKTVRGYIPNRCDYCGEFLQPSKLLYPVANKDYSSDEDLKLNWDMTQKYISNAFMITIFGYSAPKTDKAAVDLLQQAWGGNSDRPYEQISIIDIIDANKLIDTWDSFIYSHHHIVTDNFFDSYLGKFPRRSCEAVFDMFLGNQFQNGDNGFKRNFTFGKIKDFILPLIKEENNNNKDNLPNPYKYKK